MRGIKTWVALAGMAALTQTALAQTQGDVTVYGVIDSGLTYVTGPTGSQELRTEDGILNGNRWGLKGQEDLGNGVKAIFTLEDGFNLNTGEVNHGGALFGRQAYLGLQNEIGSLTLGRQWDFTWDYVEPFNISAFGSGYAVHQGDFDRMSGDNFDNSLKFSSQDFGGVTFGAMFSFSNISDSFHDGSGWSVGMHYQSGPFASGIAYTQLNQTTADPYAQIGVSSFLGQTVAVKDPATGGVTDLYADTPLTIDKLGTMAVGASYDFGRLTMAGNFTYTDIRSEDDVSSSMKVYEIGGMYDITAALQGVLGYQHTLFEDTHWNQVTAALVYSLSKRTQVYVSGDYLTASDGTHAVIGYSFAPAQGSHQSDVRIGMSHFF